MRLPYDYLIHLLASDAQRMVIARSPTSRDWNSDIVSGVHVFWLLRGALASNDRSGQGGLGES